MNRMLLVLVVWLCAIAHALVDEQGFFVMYTGGSTETDRCCVASNPPSADPSQSCTNDVVRNCVCATQPGCCQTGDWNQTCVNQAQSCMSCTVPEAPPSQSDYYSCNIVDQTSGLKFDLQPLYRNASNYQLSPPSAVVDFFLNLCGPVVEPVPAACQNASVCEKWGTAADSSASLGTARSAVFQYKNEQLSLYFRHGTTQPQLGIQRSSVIRFVCDVKATQSTIEFVREFPTSVYEFTWTTAHACPLNPPTPSPSQAPSASPSGVPSGAPSAAPSASPSGAPSGSPSAAPSAAPSGSPSGAPSQAPSPTPSGAPSQAPSGAPSQAPSGAPSAVPSQSPSPSPAPAPTPSSTVPSSPASPSEAPSGAPSPSNPPSFAPSPSNPPSGSPSPSPSVSPSKPPSPSHTTPPTPSPSHVTPPPPSPSHKIPSPSEPISPPSPVPPPSDVPSASSSSSDDTAYPGTPSKPLSPLAWLLIIAAICVVPALIVVAIVYYLKRRNGNRRYRLMLDSGFEDSDHSDDGVPLLQVDPEVPVAPTDLARLGLFQSKDVVRHRPFSVRPDSADLENMYDQLPVLKAETIQVQFEIGRGHYGEVFKGLYLSSQPIALRLPFGVESEEERLEFFAGLSKVAALKHPNVLALMGAVVISSKTYVVYEHASKGTALAYLRSQSRKGSPAPLLDKLYIVGQVVCAMAYCERNNVPHKNLSLRNVLLSESATTSDGIVCKLSDVGVVRNNIMEKFYTNPERSFPIKWVAPEWLRFHKFTPRSDVWSFGILLWEAIEDGKEPYPGQTNLQALESVLAGQTMRKSAQCPDDAFAVMQQCWRAQPEARPSFADLKREIYGVCRNLKQRLGSTAGRSFAVPLGLDETAQPDPDGNEPTVDDIMKEDDEDLF